MIVFASNATGWDDARKKMIPGGMTDAYISPILEHLPDNSYIVDRQPRRDAVNVYLAVRSRYGQGRKEIGRKGVQISHGIADKSYRRGSKMYTFHYVTSPGPTHTKRFVQSGVYKGKIREVGYPKLDPIFQGRIAQPERDDRIRVLYAPTHGGGSERYVNGNKQAPGAGATSWWHSDEIMSLFDPDKYDVVFAPHPRHRKDKRSTLHEYVGADVVIADGGSTIYESWVLGLPVVFPSWMTKRRNMEREAGRTLEARIYTRQIGYHAVDAKDLVYGVDKAAANGISAVEEQFAEGVLPLKSRGKGGELHAQFLMSIM